MKEKKKKIVWQILALVKQYPRHFLGLLLISILQSVVNGATVLLVGPITEEFLGNPLISEDDPAELRSFLENIFGSSLGLQGLFIVFGGLLLFAGVFSVFSKFAVLKIKYAVLTGLMTDTMRTFFQAQYRFFYSGQLGELLNSFQKEVDKLGDSFGLVVTGFVSLFQVVIFLAIPIILAPYLVGQFLLITLLLTAPLWGLRRWATRYGERNTRTANIVAQTLHESLTSAKLIIGFQKQERSVALFRKNFVDHSHAAIRVGTLVSGVNLMFVPLGTIGALIVIYTAYDKGVAVGELAMVLFAFFRALPLLATILQIKTNIESFVPAFDQIDRLTRKAESLKERSGIEKFVGLQKCITLRNLSFGYDNNQEVFTNLNLQIDAGELTGFVGASGAGKSTISDLLMGIIVPTAGEILVDNVPLEQLNLETYRGRIGFVPQSSQLLNISIRDNIQWANSEATDEEIIAACEKAHASDFIAKLPGNFDYIVGDRGDLLSGGQKQRLALARALVRQPDILILDEATNSLDRESERFINQAVEELIGKITIIVIAHRISSVKAANNIFVIGNGGVLESGTYGVLSSKEDGYLFDSSVPRR